MTLLFTNIRYFFWTDIFPKLPLFFVTSKSRLLHQIEDREKSRSLFHFDET